MCNEVKGQCNRGTAGWIMSVFIVCLFVCLFGKPVARLAKIKGPFSTMGFTVFNRGTCPKTIQFYKARPIRVMVFLICSDSLALCGCCAVSLPCLLCLCVCQDQRAPNIMAMVKSFNNVALLVPTEILEEATPHARAKVISTYIKVRVMV